MPLDPAIGYPTTAGDRVADRLADYDRRLRLLETGRGVPLVSGLPADPTLTPIIDYLADATNGVVWRLRYRAASASAYKWEYIGGSPLTSIVNASSTRSTSTSYGAPNTGSAPSVTTPLAGDYFLQHGATLYSPQNGQTAFANLAVGGGIAELQTYVFGTGVTEFTTALSGAAIATGVAASTAIAQQYKGNAAGGSTQTIKWIAMTPVRVG